MNPNQSMDALNGQLANLSAAKRLKTAFAQIGGQMVFASSLGAEDQVITDMLAKLNFPIPIVTLDTGRLPQETYATLEATERHYGIRIAVYFPDAAAVEQMVAEQGVNLFYRSVENRKRCCATRKIEPLRRALAGKSGWVCGLRRQQSVTRHDIPFIQWDETFGLWKLCPLADWTQAQVWDYIKANDVPYNPLHDQGYPSIGCAPCTRAVQPGQDIRAGRWWWEQPEHRECGLHWNKKQKLNTGQNQ